MVLMDVSLFWVCPQPLCYCLCAHLSIAAHQPPIHPSDSLAEQPGVRQACCTSLCCKCLYFCWLGKSCWSQFLLKYFALKRGKEVELQGLEAPFTARLNFFRSAANSYQHCLPASGVGGWFGKALYHVPPFKPVSCPPDFRETIQITHELQL